MKIKLDPLDKLFSEYIRKKSNGFCQRCGTYHGWKNLQCCHMFTRRKKSVRWDPDNACACDFGCHQYLDSNPIEKIEFWKNLIGEDKFDLLNVRAHQPGKVDRNAITLWLKQEIKRYE